MARTSSLTNVATVTRLTKAWYPGGWDFTNGGAITGDLVEYANNIPRDGAQGLLVEEGSVNQIRNPRGEGATGTTSPTNWSVVAGGTTINYTATTFNGWPATRVAITGTASGTIQILFDNTGAVSASSGEGWTLSTGVILESGTLPTTLQHTVQERSSGGSLLAAANDTIVPDNTHKRFVTSRTLTEATTAFVSAGVRFPSASGSVNCTLLILAPQLEQKAYPTSPILPPVSSPTARTRDADNITLDLGAWFTDDAFSFYVSFTPNQVSSVSQVVFGFSDGAFTDTVYIVTETSGTITTAVRAGGSPLFSDNNFPSAAVAATQSRVAVGIESDNFASSCNGKTQKTDTSGTVGQLTTRATIGNSPWSTGASSGTLYIEEIRYWPRRLTNSELEALVGN